eukprot:700652-Prorocentrum_minimum.AAC.1
MDQSDIGLDADVRRPQKFGGESNSPVVSSLNKGLMYVCAEPWWRCMGRGGKRSATVLGRGSSVRSRWALESISELLGGGQEG